jgi:lipopolysaccharide transport system ATP-binding protein
VAAPIIRVEGLGKKYHLRHQANGQPRYQALRDILMDGARTVARRMRRPFAARKGQTREEFWALTDVSFEVTPGEVVGIIGRNGAGKSTLLKLLSRITEPTTGRVTLGGRVASLLEVGTGFHAELTGRENIYLNGAILGMTRAEIRRKFDEIVAFAEVEKFLDTAVKHYSTGMYMRLAFAVAANLESDVLVVDEVLAVGDAEFQKKCFAQMQKVSRSGRTTLFVSHNMASMRQICQRGLVLDAGRLIADDTIDAAIDQHLARHAGTSASSCETDSYKLVDVRISPRVGNVIKTFDPVTIEVRVIAKTMISDPGIYVGILTMDNLRIAGLDFNDYRTIEPLAPGQEIVLGFEIQSLPLMPGQYQLELQLKDLYNQRFETVPIPLPFEVIDTPVYSSRKLDHWFGHTGLKATAICHREQPPACAQHEFSLAGANGR